MPSAASKVREGGLDDDRNADESVRLLNRLTLSYCRCKTFPPLPPHHCGLEYLNIFGSGSVEDNIVFSLVRAHGATLRELHLSTASSKPARGTGNFYENLDTRLGQCGLRCLKCLVLSRTQLFSSEKVPHCVSSCKQQVKAIAAELKKGGAISKTVILCTVCDKHCFQ